MQVSLHFFIVKVVVTSSQQVKCSISIPLTSHVMLQWPSVILDTSPIPLISKYKSGPVKVPVHVNVY